MSLHTLAGAIKKLSLHLKRLHGLQSQGRSRDSGADTKKGGGGGVTGLGKSVVGGGGGGGH